MRVVLEEAIAAAGWKISEVVSGACGIHAGVRNAAHRIALGADGIGEAWAKDHAIPVRRFYADWDEYGLAAGPRRNREMAEYADAVIALPGGRGTKSMVAEAIKIGKPVYDARNLDRPHFKTAASQRSTEGGER